MATLYDFCGGSAFPENEDSINSGISKLEWFAGIALSGIVANPAENGMAQDTLAKWAFDVAGAMLSEYGNRRLRVTNPEIFKEADD